MLVIRLIRIGKKNASCFRVILTEKKTAAKSGKFLEVLGSYNARLLAKNKDGAAGGKEITLNKERIKYWLSQGAKASDTVHNLLVKYGIIEGPKIAKKIKAKKSKGAPESEQPTEEKSGEKETAESDKKEEKAEEKKEEKKSASKKNLDKPQKESKIETK